MTLTLKHAITAALLMLLAASVLAGPLEEGREAASQGDYGTALRLLNPLAAEGNADAQVDLGKMYEIGQGVAKNEAEAARWYRKAADQGDAQAQYNLGIMYDFGQGVPQSSAEAARWYSRAADQDHALSKYNLGLMYTHGRGVPKDLVEAHKWLNLAGDLAAVKYRDIVAQHMTPAQIAEAQKRAREWKPTK